MSPLAPTNGGESGFWKNRAVGQLRAQTAFGIGFFTLVLWVVMGREFFGTSWWMALILASGLTTAVGGYYIVKLK
jgi:hypothetical protein